MSELLPCPFCGGEVEMLTGPNDSALIGCPKCEPLFKVVSIWRPREYVISRWNTRYERTCHIVESNEIWDGDLWEVVLSCGHEHLVPPEELPLVYCSDCGAKVVD